jgi:hypothetical protein
MIFTLGHGQLATLGPAVSLGAEAVPASAAFAASTGHDAGLLESVTEVEARADGLFGYLFPNLAVLPGGDAQTAALDRLAAVMIDRSNAGEIDGPMAPVMTYFGQFIDHDITAGTDFDAGTGPLRIDIEAVEPQPRHAVVASLRNARLGSLGLDSVYGDGPSRAGAAASIELLLRDGAKMRIGVAQDVGNAPAFRRPPLPADDGVDLPRVGTIVDLGLVTREELPQELGRPGEAGDSWQRTAFIADDRNDENLIVAQFHVAMLRFHNAIVDSLGAAASFEEARRLTRWHYQWLVINAFLPAVCDPSIVRSCLDRRAPLYTTFVARNGTAPSGALPLPLEFSAAAFRFGHSMVRSGYSFNLNFGPGRPGGIATMKQMFEFTGKGADPIGGPGIALPLLPHNWIIDWADMLGTESGSAQRARAIDTRIVPPLGEMINQPGGGAVPGLMKKLAARNLRRGLLLNLPGAEALIDAVNAAGLATIPPVSPEALWEGFDPAFSEAFVAGTPLWFYVLREAELAGTGRLGALGSLLVADTLVGLIVHDPESHLNAPGGSWTPAQGAKPKGETVDSLARFFRAAGLLD